MGKIERGMQAPANAVYFSIFYCGCKQLKSIHLEIRCKGTSFQGKHKIPADEKDENELKYFNS